MTWRGSRKDENRGCSHILSGLNAIGERLQMAIGKAGDVLQD